MKLLKNLTRRTFLNLGLGGLAVLLLGKWQTEFVRKHAVKEMTALHFENFFKNPHSAAVVGKEYLKLYPQESDKNLLVSKMTAGHSKKNKILMTRDELKRQYYDLIQDDFDQDRMVQIEGWFLSRTEARLCALTAITRSL